MKSNLPMIAALAAGGYLLSRQMKKSHGPASTFSLDRMPSTTAEPRSATGAALAMAGALAAGAGGLLLTERLRSRDGAMATVEESIEIDVPVSTAYNQWTQFEQFPKFMASVEEVKQLDDTHLHWRAMVGGKMKEWDAEITEQLPDQRIAWRSTTGVPNGGAVTFHKIGDSRTRVMLQMDYQPQTLAEKLGDAVGGVKLTAKGNLKRFKKLVEARGVETGAWRGTVPQH